jgi:hypothetical protein
MFPSDGGAKTMRKLLLGLGVLCLASVAAPAMAQGWGGTYSGYGYDNGRFYADTVRQHARACSEHERFHERLAEEHADEHARGFYDGEDHADAHDALDEAHDSYHDDHPDLGDCGYWNRQYYRMLEGYSYPRRATSYPSWSFGYRGY